MHVVKPPPDVDTLARRLPRREPSVDRAQRMRRALLEAAGEAPPPPWWCRAPWLIGATAAVAAAAVALILLRDTSVEVAAPHVAAVPGETPAPAVAPRPVERELADGVATFGGERPLRLTRGDAAITAPAGARFEVTVTGGEVRAIRVFSGSVVFAPSASAAATTIVERETWSLPAPPPPPAPAPSPPPPRSRAPVVAPPPEPPATAKDLPPLARVQRPVPSHELDFRDGLRTLVAGDARGAATALDRACTTSPNPEDACYWAAVARLRAGERARALAAFAEVLARWPATTHAGEANVALGWLLLESGDRAGAHARFTRAVDDPVPAVAAEARRGVAAAR